MIAMEWVPPNRFDYKFLLLEEKFWVLKYWCSAQLQLTKSELKFCAGSSPARPSRPLTIFPALCLRVITNLANIYLFKANNENIRERCEICSKINDKDARMTSFTSFSHLHVLNLLLPPFKIWYICIFVHLIHTILQKTLMGKFMKNNPNLKKHSF